MGYLLRIWSKQCPVAFKNVQNGLLVCCSCTNCQCCWTMSNGFMMILELLLLGHGFLIYAGKMVFWYIFEFLLLLLLIICLFNYLLRNVIYQSQRSCKKIYSIIHQWKWRQMAFILACILCIWESISEVLWPPKAPMPKLRGSLRRSKSPWVKVELCKCEKLNAIPKQLWLLTF